MSRMRYRLPRTRLLLLFLVLLLIPGCFGGDFENLSLEVEKWDHGWLIAVEPEENFTINLFGNNAHPDQQWRLVEYDTAVLQLDGEEHQKPRPPMADVEAAEPDQVDEGILVSSSHFGFTGVATGTTPLRFEFVADGEPIDVAEYTIEVVEDACDADTLAVANRCGRPGFASHPQVIHEPDYGQEVVLEAGESTELMLMANALYEGLPWQAVTYDDSVVAVDGPVALGPGRPVGDFTSELDEDASHSFLPAWQFTITGVAPGESELVVEIAADGRQIDVFEITVIVE